MLAANTDKNTNTTHPKGGKFKYVPEGLGELNAGVLGQLGHFLPSSGRTADITAPLQQAADHLSGGWAETEVGRWG